MDEVVRDFRPGADEGPVQDLWDRVFGAPTGGQTIEWLFRPGPAGSSPRSVVEADGRVVAHAGGVALRFRIGAEDGRGAYSVGAMTDRAFQGRGLFFRVGEHLYDRLEREGFGFVAGFSNRNSHRLMTGPLRRTAIRPFPWAVRVLRPFALFRSLLRRRAAPAAAASPAPLTSIASRFPGISLREIDPKDPRCAPALDGLWKRAAAGIELGAVRDAAYFAWRYGTRPDAAYRVFLAERDGEAAGLLAYRALALRGVRAGFVLDLVLPAEEPGAASAGAALLAAAEGIARAESASLLSVLLPTRGPVADALRRAGFRRIPERLHPQLIRFSVRGLGRFTQSKMLEDPDAWHLSWADTDVV